MVIVYPKKEMIILLVYHHNARMSGEHANGLRMEDIQEQVGNTFRKRIHTSFVLEFPCLQNTINGWKLYFHVVNG